MVQRSYFAKSGLFHFAPTVWKGICNIEEGNEFLATYMEKHNRKFAVLPACDEDR